MLGTFVLGTCQVVVILYSITQAGRWAADDAEGRLEMLLSQPVSRRRVVFERGASLALGVALIVTASLLGLLLVAPSQAVTIDLHRLLLAGLPPALLGLVFGAAGAALTGWWPRRSLIVLAGYAALAYLIQQVGPVGRWPAWIQDLSPLRLGGEPLAGRLDWGGLALLGVLTAVGLAGAAATMQRREVGR